VWQDDDGKSGGKPKGGQAYPVTQVFFEAINNPAGNEGKHHTLFI